MAMNTIYIAIGVTIAIIVVLYGMLKFKNNKVIKLIAPFLVRLSDELMSEGRVKLTRAIAGIETIVLGYCHPFIRPIVDKLINAEKIAEFIEGIVFKLRNDVAVEYNIKGAEIIKKVMPELTPKIDAIMEEVAGLEEKK